MQPNYFTKRISAFGAFYRHAIPAPSFETSFPTHEAEGINTHPVLGAPLLSGKRGTEVAAAPMAGRGPEETELLFEAAWGEDHAGCCGKGEEPSPLKRGLKGSGVLSTGT